MADPTGPTDQPEPTARPARKRRTSGFGGVLAVGARVRRARRLRRRPDLGHRRHHQPRPARGRRRRLRRRAGDVPARAGGAGLLGRVPRAAHTRAPRRRRAGRAGRRGRSGRRDPLRARRHRRRLRPAQRHRRRRYVDHGLALGGGRRPGGLPGRVRGRVPEVPGLGADEPPLRPRRRDLRHPAQRRLPRRPRPTSGAPWTTAATRPSEGSVGRGGSQRLRGRGGRRTPSCTSHGPPDDQRASAYRPKERETDRAIGRGSPSLRADVPSAGPGDRGLTDLHHDNGSPR